MLFQKDLEIIIIGRDDRYWKKSVIKINMFYLKVEPLNRNIVQEIFYKD